MRQKLTLITLGVRDLRKSLEFYENGLGWKRLPQSMDELPLFRLGGMVLSLYGWSHLADDATLDPQGSGFRGITLAYNAVSREEVDAVFAQLHRIGADVVKPPQDVFWGGHSGYFADLDGHLWEVAWNPYFTLNERGEVVLP